MKLTVPLAISADLIVLLLDQFSENFGVSLGRGFILPGHDEWLMRTAWMFWT